MILTMYSTFSEEALEHGNKDIKDVTISHSRQSGYENRNRDTCNFLLDGSDPKVLSSRPSRAQNRTKDPYPRRVISWCKDDEDGIIRA